MSHIASVQCEIRDLEALKVACAGLGWQFVAGQRSYQWFGRWVGDTPMPDDCTLDDLGKCDHAIKLPGCRYEVGVVRVGDSYRLRFDYYEGDPLAQKIGGPGAPVLKQAYAVAAATREARRRGFSVRKQVQQDGTVKLRMRRG